jgi:hypothetical protein
MLDAMHIKSIQDVRAYDSMLAKRLKQGALSWEDEVLLVTNYHEEQEIAPSDTKQSVKDRVRRYREQHRQPVTPKPLQSDVPNVSSNLLVNGVLEEGECNAVTALHKNGKTTNYDSDGNEKGVTVSREFRASFARVPRAVTELVLQKQNAAEVWQQALEQLKGQVTSLNFSTWLEGSEGLSLDNNLVVVSVKSAQAAAFLNNNQRSLAANVVSHICGQSSQVQFCAQGGNR